MKKKIISLLLCAAIALSLVTPLTASAEVMTSEISVTLELGKKYTDGIIETTNRYDDQYTWMEGAVPGLTFTSVVGKSVGDYDYYMWYYSGVPTTPGTYEVVMQTEDTNHDGYTERTVCKITVKDQPHKSVAHTAFCGEEYSYELKGDEGRFYDAKYAAAEGLEDTGLSLQNYDGKWYVEGEIDQPGHIPYSVWLLYSDGGYKKYVVDLYAAYPRFSASETARTGEDFAHDIEIVDTYYADYFNYSVTSGELPDGLRITNSMDGPMIGGSPTEPGSYVIKLDLHFEDGTVATYTLTLKVECGQHDPEDMWYADDSTHWRFCTICDKGIDEGDHAGGKATCQEKALCEICNEPYGSYGAHDWNGKTCRLCGEIRQDPFSDVPAGSWYYDSVVWAVQKGITSGSGADTFSPGGVCQRAAVVTFLWRAAGSTEPKTTENPFVDVNPSDFYYKAVLWAVENGITNGSDPTHFNPFGVCNRAQVVTFLHRALGAPAPSGDELPFTDVPAGAWFEAAVAWAVENGITNGMTATEFGPNSNCNRAQVVTFMHRALVGNGSQGGPLRVDRQPKSIVLDGAGIYNSSRIECTFDVVVVGGQWPYTYNWEYKENGNWISFHSADSSVDTYGNSATTASLIAQFTPKQLAYDEAKEVRCVITDFSGKTVTSQTAVASFAPLEIETHPTDLNQQGVRTAYCFDVSVKGGYYRDSGYSYQWQQYDPDEAGWVFMDNSESVSGARTESLKIITDEPDPDALYRCKITDDNGTEVFSDYACINPYCVITKEPKNVSTLNGDKAEFSVTAGGGSGIYTYKWQVMLPETSVFVDVAGVYGLEATGTDKAKLSVSLADDSLYEAKFRCVVTDLNGSVAVTRDASLMEEFNVKFRTEDHWNTGGALGKNSFRLYAFADGGSGEYTYTWYKKSVPVGVNMGTYPFAKTDDDDYCVSATARRNYVVVYKCVVSDGNKTEEHEFYLQYANS